MAVVVVTGGTGTLGRYVVERLRPEHEVRVVSRRAGDGRAVADLTTGVGVADAVNGAEVAVHAASDTRSLGRGDEAQTRHLLECLPAQAHLVYVSIVGIDRVPYRYYRRKLACEHMIEASGRPHTIVRITQFHELIAMGLSAVERLPVAPLPVSWRFQPIAAAEAADVVVESVRSGPTGRAPDAGGPEVLELGSMAREWRQVRGRPRTLSLPVPGRVGAAFRRGDNTVPGNPVGRRTWSQFVASLPPRHEPATPTA